MDSYSKLLERENHPSHFAPLIGVVVTRIWDRKAEGYLDVTPDVLNPMGIVHGGAMGTLADTVAGCAAFTCGQVCVTLDCTMQYLAPGTGSRLFCRAEPKKLGKTILVYDIVITNDQGQMVATGTYTFFAKEITVEEAGF